MSASSEIADTWRAIIDCEPGARSGDPLILKAAFEHPMLSSLYPFPTHGTLKFYRTPPATLPVDPSDELPFIVCGGPPYQIYAAGYGRLVGEGATPAAAVALLAAALSDTDSAH